jgi:hypothetical protein
MNHYEYLDKESRNQWFDERRLTKILNCPKEDVIILPERIRVHEELQSYIETTIQYVIHRLNTEGWHKKIVFFLPSEAFATIYLKYMHEVSYALLVNHQVKYKNIYFVTGAADIEYNHALYYKYSVQMGYTPIQIIYTNTFEGGMAQDAKKRELYHSNLPERKKKILFFNKQPRAHRLAAISELMKRNLRNQTYLSFVMDSKRVNFTHVKLLLPKMIDVTTHYIRKLFPEMPINLSLAEDEANMHHLLETDMMIFRNSLFSLVAETLFHHSVDYRDPHIQSALHCFPCTFFTEKTWKAVRAKHPFLLLTTPYALRGLRELGYQTFHPYINESYDDIEDDQTRLEAVMNEVERLANMDDNQTRVFLENIHPIVKHNYNVLCTKDYSMNLR